MTDLNSHYSIAEEQAKKYQEKPLIHNSLYKSELKFINIYKHNNNYNIMII